MNGTRECGILLHPTSLPSRYGIGDLGREAYNFIDYLKLSNQKYWQILPLVQVGYGWSPYQSPSAFAGNTLLIDPEDLVEQKLLDKEDLQDIPSFSQDSVDYEKVKEFKESIFKKAFYRFERLEQKQEFFTFLEENEEWLPDYSLFMALKEYFNFLPWNKWDKEIAERNENALLKYKKYFSEKIRYYNFLQFIFCKQWEKLKKYANENGIKIIGDIPIYVSHDSSDVWVNRSIFKLDDYGNPKTLAGVPPDYFSETGQLWGNPIYDWEELKKTNYLWWRKRLENILKFVDIVRIDHFRGFEAYWEVPAGEEDAVNGHWVKGPAEDFFETVEEYLGKLPVIAEDLGMLTEKVHKLRDTFNFPGMKVLQFSFQSDEKELFNTLFKKNIVLYTGTHDNNTTLGWFKNEYFNNSSVRKYCKKYFDIDVENFSEQDVCWDFIAIAYSSCAEKVIVPLQDVLGLDSNARMNVPGTSEGNWRWRVEKKYLTKEVQEKLKKYTEQYKRQPM